MVSCPDFLDEIVKSEKFLSQFGPDCWEG